MDIEMDRLSDDDLRDAITTWAGRVAAGEARLLRLIGELDAREAWAVHGVLSCAHWLAWQLGMSATTARERVRVARALRSLPVTAAALGGGQLSYAQARAITRMASEQDEQAWVDLGRHCTAAQLDKVARGAGRARRDEQRRTEPERVAFEDRVRVRWDDDGTLVLTARIAPEHAPAVLAVLEQAQVEERAERDSRLAAVAASFEEDASAEAPEPSVFEEPPYPVLAPRGLGKPPSVAEQQALKAYWEELHQRQAKARAWQAHQERLEREAATRGLPTGPPTLGDALVRALTGPSQHRVTVQLLVDPLSGWARTRGDELLPPSTLRRLHLADAARRGSREVPPALRGLLGQVDGERCRMPGCTRSRKLHAHHVVWWSRGGRTELSNLVLVCSRHHTLIHRDGYQLTLRADRSLEVLGPDGVLVPHRVPLPRGSAEELDPQQAVTADTLPTGWTGERLDLGYVVNVMLAHAA